MCDKPTKRLELYRVSWFDPTTHAAWRKHDEAMRVQPVLCQTVGWFVSRDAQCLRLAMHYNSEDDWADIVPIPVGCLASEPEKVTEITLCQIAVTVPAETA